MFLNRIKTNILAVNQLRRNIYARAAGWVFFGQVADRVLALFNNIAIARLLSPEILGLMAIINLIYQSANLFSGIGINQNIVKSKRGDEPVFYNTAWTFQVIRGIFLYAIVCILAYPLSVFFKIEELIYLFPVVGIGFIISGFFSTSLATLQKRLLQKQLISVLLGSQIFGILVLISFAIYSPTIWAFIVGVLSQLIVRLALSYFVLSDISNRFHFEKRAFLEIFHFGKWIFVLGIFMFLSKHIDTVIFARLMPLGMLGIYSVAKLLTASIGMLAQRMGAGVIFPFYAANSDNVSDSQFGRREFRLIAYTLGLFGFVIAFFFAFGDIFVDYIYGSRYADAGWMFSLLCVGLWFSTLANVISSKLTGQGNPRLAIVGDVGKTAVILMVAATLFASYGPLGAITAVVLGDGAAYIFLAVARGHFRSRYIWYEFLFTAAFITLAAGMSMVRYALGFGVSIVEIMPI